MADLTIKMIQFEYNDETKKILQTGKRGIIDKKKKYKYETDFLNGLKKRNKAICALTLSLKGNTLVIFEFVEHGKEIFEKLNNNTVNRPVHFVYGKVKGEERNEIRKIVETQDNAIIVASSKTFSTGINIPSLKNVILINSGKAKIKLLQSIGRALRKPTEDKKATVYDIVDNLSYKRSKCFSMIHMAKRMELYIQEKLDFKLIKVDLK